MKEKCVHYFTTKNETKCSIVERFNRTLKEKMWKHFTHKDTHLYLKVLPKLVNSYNSSVHSCIKMKPKDVNIDNQHIALDTLYGKYNAVSTTSAIKFKVSDDVQISKMKHTFSKSYQGNWSYEILTVVKVIPRNPPVFKIKDYDGKEIEGLFYSEELQKVKKSKDSYWQIEKVLKIKMQEWKNWISC